MTDELADLRSRLSQVERERNEARRIIRNAHQAIRTDTTAAAVALAMFNTGDVGIPSLLDELDSTRAERDEARLAAAQAINERDAAVALIGDETAGGDNWRGVTRAEAIRQADMFHAGQLRWLNEHDARRDERDEARAERDSLSSQLAAEIRANIAKVAEVDRQWCDNIDAVTDGFVAEAAASTITQLRSQLAEARAKLAKEDA